MSSGFCNCFDEILVLFLTHSYQERKCEYNQLTRMQNYKNSLVAPRLQPTESQVANRQFGLPTKHAKLCQFSHTIRQTMLPKTGYINIVLQSRYSHMTCFGHHC